MFVCSKPTLTLNKNLIIPALLVSTHLLINSYDIYKIGLKYSKNRNVLRTKIAFFCLTIFALSTIATPYILDYSFDTHLSLKNSLIINSTAFFGFNVIHEIHKLVMP